ncbi:MAG: protein-disulfide reductase DsbD [Campylobacteraceae bacterium]|nr:protein-disulfide reductase DsbD [Campylobacteraceae bacterium]
MKHNVKLIFFFMMLYSSLFATQTQKILTPEEAFSVTSEQNQQGVVVTVKLGEAIYLYDDKFKIELIEPKVLNLDRLIQRPKAELFHDYMTLRQSFDIIVPQSLLKEYVKSGSFTLKISYQGCSELGLCYQPMDAKFTFDIEGTKLKNNTTLSEQDTIASSLASGNLVLVLLSFFGFGLLLSLTPCVFPMIPILSSIIASQSTVNMTAKKGFLLSLVYVIAMSFAYTIAGVLAGMFGANLQASLQNPWVLASFSAVFVILAFSMFGFYEIKMPNFIQTKLSKKSDEAQTQGVFGVAVMGFLSALIVGPCVAAPLAGALIYIGQSGNALLGGSALFVMSLGMGVPLLIVGTTAGKYMPRPGGWMENVKAIFGVMMLGVAIWMLSRIIPLHVSMFLWMLLVLMSSIYLGALEPLRVDVSGWHKLLKSLVVILFLYGVVLFLGSISGATNPLNPLEKFISKEVGKEILKTDFARIQNGTELSKALKASSSKPVMLDFYADWCVNCIELENFTFSDARVKEKLKNFTLLQIDVTKNSDEDKRMQKEFGVFGPPAILFFKNGEELQSLRVIGFKNADEFLAHLEKIGL